jgi:RecB family endonuclease NucS
MLRYSNGYWGFVDELELENFVWNCLSEIFNLIPLERQFNIKGQICDILAVTNENQLVIIELKNTTDRYVINQLTRYYDLVIQERPFQETVDYEKEVLLYAVCAFFHEHNLVDVKYNKLNFNLYEAVVVKKESEFRFIAYDIQDKKIRGETTIRYQEPGKQEILTESFSTVNSLLAKWLDFLSEEEKINILKIRQKFLNFDERIKEVEQDKNIVYGSQYGKDKVRSVAEFKFDARSKKILVFLWLRDWWLKNSPLLRCQIHTVNNYAEYYRCIFVKDDSISYKGLNHFSVGHKFYGYQANGKRLFYSAYVAKTNGSYYKRVGMGLDSLFAIKPIEKIIEEALSTWLEKIPKKE